ncbi:MAG TPA: hypothetical protein VE078_02055 [Thermoanaerobaculia bacterium]|nr:hypothetical protein [Thermoanaerobaculia bacterium]
MRPSFAGRQRERPLRTPVLGNQENWHFSWVEDNISILMVLGVVCPPGRVGLNPKLIGVLSSLIVLGVGMSAARTEAAE